MKEKLGLRLSAKAAIDADSGILVLHPSDIDANRHWHIPGGIRDNINEPLDQTLRREVFEETGIDLSGVDARPFKIGEWQAIDHGQVVKILAVFFYIHLPHRPEIKLSDEHDDSAWLTRLTYREFDTNPEVTQIIEELYAGRFSRSCPGN